MFDFSVPEYMISELKDEIRLFYKDDIAPDISFSYNEISGLFVCKTNIDGKEYQSDRRLNFTGEALQDKRTFNRFLKLSIYLALKNHTGIQPPWGSLTGIRPSKLVYEYLGAGIGLDKIAELLVEDYDVSGGKADLIVQTVKNQSGIYVNDDSLYTLYVHIPFCTSKCAYCSFITLDAHKSKAVIPEYIKKLRTEIDEALRLINEKGRLHSIYVGGGTPTAIDVESLDYILSAFTKVDVEFTVEAGRPDTITREKLDVLKKHNVNRICVNPQTLNDKTLQLIGRSHSVSEFFDKYELSRNYGFDINIDVIAGLPDENLIDFENTIKGVTNLKPENITVHTLSIKRGSAYGVKGFFENPAASEMVENARTFLKKSGYQPYYLYRQKQMANNLENTGYCIDNKQCANNIVVMEECTSVVACGAGAINKRVFNDETRIERLANLRDVKLYLEKFSERLQDKTNFFTK